MRTSCLSVCVGLFCVCVVGLFFFCFCHSSRPHLTRLCEQEVEAVMLLFAVLKNMSSDSDAARLLLMRQGSLEAGALLEPPTRK